MSRSPILLILLAAILLPTAAFAVTIDGDLTDLATTPGVKVCADTLTDEPQIRGGVFWVNPLIPPGVGIPTGFNFERAFALWNRDADTLVIGLDVTHALTVGAGAGGHSRAFDGDGDGGPMTNGNVLYQYQAWCLDDSLNPGKQVGEWYRARVRFGSSPSLWLEMTWGNLGIAAGTILDAHWVNAPPPPVGAPALAVAAAPSPWVQIEGQNDVEMAVQNVMASAPPITGVDWSYVELYIEAQSREDWADPDLIWAWRL